MVPICKGSTVLSNIINISIIIRSTCCLTTFMSFTHNVDLQLRLFILGDSWATNREMFIQSQLRLLNQYLSHKFPPAGKIFLEEQQHRH